MVKKREFFDKRLIEKRNQEAEEIKNKVKVD